MAKIKKSHTMSELDIKSLIRKGEISSELKLERASLALRNLRLLSIDQPKLSPLARELSALIRDYETKNWTDYKQVTEKQFKESELAEKLAAKEFKFYKKRRELILKKLKYYGLNQNDLAAFLAHNKSYTSELLNGIRAFSMNDLIIIHRLFEIRLEDLINTEIPIEVQKRLNEAIEKSALVKSNEKKSPRASSLAKSLSGALKVSGAFNERMNTESI